MTAQTHSDQQVATEFHELVNMTAARLEHWLQTDESKSVGIHKDGASEAVGHVSGRAIVEILHSRKREYSPEQYTQMRRTVSYIKRHLAERPQRNEVEHTRWAASLKNWGHDPAKHSAHGD